MPLFLSTAAGDPPPSSPSSVPEAVQLHSDLLVDFASRRTVDLGLGRRGPAAAGAAASGGGADGGGDASAGDDGSGSRRHSALTYQAVQTRGDGAADSGDRTGADVNRNGRPDLGVWDCRVRPSTASASAALLRRVVVDRAGPRGADGECEAAAGEGGSEDPKGKIEETGGIGGRSVPILATVDLSDPALVQPALEAMRSAVVEMYAGDAARRDHPSCTTSLRSLGGTTFGSARTVEEVAAGGSDGGRRVALIVAAVVPPPAGGARSARDEYVERQSRSLVLYHLNKFALETDCTLCFVSAGEDVGEENLEANDAGGGAPPAMSIDYLGRLVRRVALGMPPVERDGNAESQSGAEAADGDGSPGRPPCVQPPGSHDGEVVRGALLRNASCEGRWDASSDDLVKALPPSNSRPSGGGAGKGTNAATEGGGAAGDDPWLSRLADTVGVAPEPAATPKRVASAPSSGNSVLSAKGGGRAAASAAGGKSTAKKRGERVRAAKAKDGKPKDEREVMNFFDSLLKK